MTARARRNVIVVFAMLACAVAIGGLLLPGALDSNAGAQSRDCLSRREYIVNPRVTSTEYHDREDGKIRVESWYSETEETWLIRTCNDGREETRSLQSRVAQRWMNGSKVWPDDYADDALARGWSASEISLCSQPRHLIGRGLPRINTCWRIVFAIVEGRPSNSLPPHMRMPPR